MSDFYYGNSFFSGMKNQRREFSKVVSTGLLTDSLIVKDDTTNKGNVTINGDLTVKSMKVKDGGLTIDVKEGEVMNINGQVNIEQSAYTDDFDIINIQQDNHDNKDLCLKVDNIGLCYNLDTTHDYYYNNSKLLMEKEY